MTFETEPTKMDTQGTETFGRLISRVQSAQELLELERAHGSRHSQFTEVDSLVGRLLVRSLGGERIVTISQNDLYVNHISVHCLNDNERKVMNDWFSVVNQQSRGTWTIPDKTSLQAGLTSLRYLYTQCDKFGTAMAVEERGPVKLASAPDVVFHWAILEPLFDSLCLPFHLRGPLAGERTREQQLESWSEVDALYGALGFRVEKELAILRYGGGWHRLDSTAQLTAKLRLLEALGAQAEEEIGERYRAYRLLPLVANYYKKAKKDGRVKRKQALTKNLERTISAYWGGDWLAYLTYLGEEPHPEEQIVKALPKVKPLVSQSGRVEDIAQAQGLPPDVVKSIAASYWQKTGGVSPVEQRVQCLEKYWHAFDEIHARQTTKMKPLWGLVAEGRTAMVAHWEGRDLFQQELFRELLPESLLTEIEKLWAGTMNPKWPDRIFSEPFPHQVMTETFGPALKFWDGCSLTAWFLCEGPYSRTDMKGLAHYHRKEIAALAEMGTSVDEQLFTDLIKAEEKLGPPEEIRDKSSSADYGGISVTFSVSTGSRRKGFRNLRDIITRYRRAWAARYLQAYLKNRWESEITEAANAFNLRVQDKDGRVPTLKQYAKAAATATNHWFGGDISGLYSAIREKCPVQPQRVKLMPENVTGFAQSLFDSLTEQASRFRGNDEAKRYSNYIEVLANLGIKYIQLEEALDRPPEMKELGEQTFRFHSIAINDDPIEIWKIFVEAIGKAKIVGAHTSRKTEQSPMPIPTHDSVNTPSPRNVSTDHDSTASISPRPELSRVVFSSQKDETIENQSSVPKKSSWWKKLLGRD